MSYRILNCDVLAGLKSLPAESVQCCVTSPPYFGLRNYGFAAQIGLERTPELYVAKLVEVFREVRRVLRDDGTLWLNLGDSYNAAGRDGHGTRIGYKQGTNRASAVGADSIRPSAEHLKPKDLIGIPWRVAFALQADGWWLRSDIIWHKPNPMPESVLDRCTKAHEYVFLLSKSAKYFYDADAVREPFVTDLKENYPARAKITGRGNQDAALARGNDRGKSGGFPPRLVTSWKDKTYDQSMLATKQANGIKGRPSGVAGFGDGGRNKRSVWTIKPKPFKGAHFAVMPEALVEPCILAGSREGDLCLDPFAGSGTVGVVAQRHHRSFIGFDLNPDYVRLAKERIGTAVLKAKAAA